MMRNQKNLEGGTKAYYTSEEWADSVEFWQKYVKNEFSMKEWDFDENMEK